MSDAPASVTFKIADRDEEFEAIHRLNYETFVEEIPQHQRNAERRLVDRFHAENTYAIAVSGGEVIGMISGRVQRPFSLDQKVPDLDAHLPPGRRIVEIRLLAVRPGHRSGPVFAGLLRTIGRHFRAHGYDLAIASGTVRQTRLYRHLGFVPFGPLVGTAEAPYQPMYLTLETFFGWSKAVRADDDEIEAPLVNLLPGPVETRPEVRSAFARPAVSHRGEAFLADFRVVRRLLREMTGARHVDVLVGSGSLGNEAVAAQLARDGAPGVVATNGEFGERLADHARRWELPFEVLRGRWGAPLDLEAVDAALGRLPPGAWLWTTHGETSTGIVNDLGLLKRLARERGARLALDAISTLGTMPVDLDGVAFASSVSGKALEALPGLALVFHHDPVAPADHGVPRYLDLGLYAAADGVPFTHSSNLVRALHAALTTVAWGEKHRRVSEASARLRTALRAAGFRVVADDAHAAPAVTTIALPASVRSTDVGAAFKARRWWIAYQSGYLIARNWIQVCLMGARVPEELDRFPEMLAELGDAAAARGAAPSPAPAR